MQKKNTNTKVITVLLALIMELNDPTRVRINVTLAAAEQRFENTVQRHAVLVVLMTYKEFLFLVRRMSPVK
jgi:hypothetical protein